MDDFGNELVPVPNWKAALYYWFMEPLAEVAVAHIDWKYSIH